MYTIKRIVYYNTMHYLQYLICLTVGGVQYYLPYLYLVLCEHLLNYLISHVMSANNNDKTKAY